MHGPCLSPNRIALIGLLFLGSLCHRADADSIRYNITDLGALPGHTSSAATNINNQGQVLGYSATNTSADLPFLYSDGKITGLPPTDGFPTYLNDAGQVSENPINNVGQTAYLGNGGGVIANAFLEGGGIRTRLDTDAAAFVPADLNDRGQVVGSGGPITFSSSPSYHPYLYSDGRLVDLGLLPGMLRGGANAINNAGQVVGYMEGDRLGGGNTHFSTAFLYSDGILHDLGGLHGSDSQALDINASGQIVGISGLRGFLYRDGAMYDLNDLIPPDSGWTLDAAFGINDSGQIVGYGLHEGVGIRRAFLLTPQPAPVPEPTTLSLLAASGILAHVFRSLAKRK
jgi:probable HAF family extracellular repeat protein